MLLRFRAHPFGATAPNPVRGKSFPQTPSLPQGERKKAAGRARRFQIDDKARKSVLCKGTPALALNGGNECRLRLRGGLLSKRTLPTAAKKRRDEPAAFLLTAQAVLLRRICEASEKEALEKSLFSVTGAAAVPSAPSFAFVRPRATARQTNTAATRFGK